MPVVEIIIMILLAVIAGYFLGTLGVIVVLLLGVLFIAGGQRGRW